MGLLFKLLLFVVAIAVILIIYQVHILDYKVEALREEIERASCIYRISELDRKE